MIRVLNKSKKIFFIFRKTQEKIQCPRDLSRRYMRRRFFGYLQCCGSGMFIPDPGCSSRIPGPNFSYPGSRSKKKSRIRIRINEFTLTQNIVSQLLEIWSKFHPGSWFVNPSPEPGVEKADPGSGSATLVTCPVTVIISTTTGILLSFRKSITY